jgi:hypothetical protein
LGISGEPYFLILRKIRGTMLLVLVRKSLVTLFFILFLSISFAQYSRVWGTYYGGTRRDEIQGIASFGPNAIYLAGWTQSDGNQVISTTGSHQLNRGSTSTGSSGRDAMLIKLDGDGNRQWATYYGGNQEDQAFGVATDSEGNIYMAGKTLSGGGISTPGSHKTGTFSYDAFLVKFNAQGVRVWGTYYGSMFQPEEGVAVAVDGLGNVYLAGIATGSTEGVSTPGAHQESIGAQTDAFLVKFNSSGVRQWGTFYGGSGNDFASACTVDKDGNVYLSGYTNSASGIATQGSHQATLNGTNNDGFLVKFNASGQRQWATYYGGSNQDWIYSCKADNSGNIIMGGATQSTEGISTQGSHQPSKGGNNLDADGFLVKFDANGSRLWATYYGGNRSDVVLALAIDTNGDIAIAGGSNSDGVIASANGFQTSVAGNGLATDGFVAIFNADGQRHYGTYYGGAFDDNGTALTFSSFGNFLLAGRTLSPGNTLSTEGAHQPAFNGDDNSASSALYDGFVVKFGSGSPSPSVFTFTGSGNWSNPANWFNGQVPPAEIPSGVSVIINPQGSDPCILDVGVLFNPGSVLQIAPGKNIILSNGLQVL